MSAKNSFNSMDPKAMQALLAVASRKLGTTPDVLNGKLESGVYDRALHGMPQKRGYDASKRLCQIRKLPRKYCPHHRQGRYSKSFRGNSIFTGAKA